MQVSLKYAVLIVIVGPSMFVQAKEARQSKESSPPQSDAPTILAPSENLSSKPISRSKRWLGYGSYGGYGGCYGGCGGYSGYGYYPSYSNYYPQYSSYSSYYPYYGNNNYYNNNGGYGYNSGYGYSGYGYSGYNSYW